MRIGFIGAGLMGHGMAQNLLKSSHEVSVIAHKNRAPIEDLVFKGAREVKNLGELAQASDYIVLCLSSSKIVEDTVFSMGPFLQNGQIIIDTGTSDPKSTRRLAEPTGGARSWLCRCTAHWRAGAGGKRPARRILWHKPRSIFNPQAALCPALPPLYVTWDP